MCVCIKPELMTRQKETKYWMEMLIILLNWYDSSGQVCCLYFPLLTHLARQQLMSVSIYHLYGHKSTFYDDSLKKNVSDLELRKQTQMFFQDVIIDG